MDGHWRKILAFLGSGSASIAPLLVFVQLTPKRGLSLEPLFKRGFSVCCWAAKREARPTESS